MKINVKLLIKISVSVLTTVLMVLAAELLGEPEIIFPEIAALTVGAFISDKLPWNVTPVRMFALMSISAVMGWVLSVYVPLPLYVKVLAAFAVCIFALAAARTTMFPMISAAILPVLTNAQSVVYPVSVLILTAAIIGIRELFVRYGLAEKNCYDSSAPEKNTELIRKLWLIIGFGAVSAIALGSGVTFIIAPPLAVVFAEAAFTDSPVHRAPFRFFLCTSLCAFWGTICRLMLRELFALPLTLGVLAAVSGAFALLIIFDKPFPPAAALSVLPFILPQSILFVYPFQAAAGAAVFISLDVVFKYCSDRGMTLMLFERTGDFFRSVKLLRPEDERIQPQLLPGDGSDRAPIKAMLSYFRPDPDSSAEASAEDTADEETHDAFGGTEAVSPPEAEPEAAPEDGISSPETQTETDSGITRSRSGNLRSRI